MNRLLGALSPGIQRLTLQAVWGKYRCNATRSGPQNYTDVQLIYPGKDSLPAPLDTIWGGYRSKQRQYSFNLTEVEGRHVVCIYSVD